MELTDGSGIKEQRPIVELLALAAPMVAQMASYTMMQFADRLMLARVGDLEAAAAGTAGIAYFSLLGFGFGVLLVVNTLASQAFGRQNLHATGQYMWQGIWFGLAFGLATLVLYPLAGGLFLTMGHEPRLAGLESSYFSGVALGGGVKLVAIAMSQFLLGLHRPGIVLGGTLCGVVANLFFNWLLIYGHWGFAPLGVAGAAWGTNAAVLVELLVMSAYLFRPVFAGQFNTFDWRPQIAKMRILMKVGVPAGFQLIADILAWMLFMNVIMGRFGTAALSANSFAFTYMHVCFMPAVGVGGAVTALVGRYIGMGRTDLAARRAHLGFVVCAIYMVTAGAGLYVFRQPLIGLFSSDPEIIRIGSQLMGFVALYQIFDAMFVVYVGALRGAGDTLVPAVVQGALVWVIVIGGGSLMVKYAPQYGVAGPWSLAMVFSGILGIFLLRRFAKGGWKSIRLHDDLEPALAVSAP